jgi:hypothetical protein
MTGTANLPVRPTAALARAPWLALCDEPVTEIHGFDRAALSALAPGTRVAVVADGPLARRRARRLAARGGIRVTRELIVLPSTGHPIVVLDDEAAAVRHLWASVATVPPGVCRGAWFVGLMLRLVRLLPWSWTGGLAPGRVVTGVRR